MLAAVRRSIVAALRGRLGIANLLYNRSSSSKELKVKPKSCNGSRKTVKIHQQHPTTTKFKANLLSPVQQEDPDPS